ncbi:hypothetical protein DVH05_008143 [Phytophthora capsici]|nr:hypothetical protein DVH05_008143 [Phytophthora capsici]
MNSGLSDLPDVGRFFGLYPTDEDLATALAFIEPAHSLRGGHDYANANFEILGQLIKEVSGQSWDIFLKERIWEPLGMTRTFPSAFDAQGDNDTSYGHFECGGEVFGPYDLVNDPEAQLAGEGRGQKIASGSTLSTSDDLATLLRLILNKGTVDGVSILKDPASVTTMITGKSALSIRNLWTNSCLRDTSFTLMAILSLPGMALITLGMDNGAMRMLTRVGILLYT